ncbi:MAG: hypothetical protein IRZ09_02130 [Variibacter sp.]|nr:hypothetical protein [Variibacter sp.]
MPDTMRSRALVLVIWAAGMVPAALLMMGLGYADWTWLGFFKAWGALLALVAAYDVIESWVERRLRRRQAWRAGRPKS